jgi:hypothetical protein
MSENAHRAARFETLAHVIASIPQETHQSCIKLNRLKSVLNSGALCNLEILKDEDPQEFAFTESFAFIDGPFTVFPGVADDTTFILQHFLKAIFRHRRQIDNQGYLDQAFQLTLAVLLLSDEIARRANLGPGIHPVYAPESPVAVPFLNRLSRLKNAVVFHRAELEGLLGSRGVPLSALNDVTVQLGRIDLATYGLNRGELFARPIVLAGDQYIVTLPGRMLNALGHTLVNLTVVAGVTQEVVARYTQSIWDNVFESFYYLNISPATPPATDLPDIPHITDGVFHLDADKYLYVILATDSLSGYDADQAFSRWQVGDLPERIKERMDVALSFLFTLPEPPNDVLVLELIQGVGRSYALPLKRPAWGPFLYMGAADLHTVAQLEAGNSLVLWKYAHAAQRIRQTTRITKASELDEFYFYRRSGYSYYGGDEERYTDIYLAPGYAGDLREELQRSRDWHSVRSFRRGPLTDLIDVTLLFSDTRIPIYVTKESLFVGAVEVLVEGLPLPVWVTNAPYRSDAQRRQRRLYAQLTEAIGYWLWQFTPSLMSVLSPLTATHPHVLIEIQVERPEVWEGPDEAPTDEPAITVAAGSGHAQLLVCFNPAMDMLLARADNHGEREMMRHVLRGLRGLLPAEDHGRLSDQVIDTILDRHAPLGVKKKLLFFDSRSVPEILPDGLPTYRALQKADENELLDELGDYLMEVKGLGIGLIPDVERTSVLRDAVGFFYEELERLVATLSPDGLLEWLVAHQEAATRDSAFNQLTIPTRLACFSSEAEMIKKMQEEMPRQNATVVASRFIIEYVTARPPKGLRPISMSVYDRLQALAWHITNFGFESDLIHFGLADHRMEILPSRRLGADRQTYEKARSAWAPKVMQGDIRRSGEFFNVLWRDVPAADTLDDEMEDLNTAAVAEFGFSLTEQLDFIVAAMRIGQIADPVVARLPRNEFTARMARELNWEDDKASRALEMLGLSPRYNFLNPGAPYRGEDVYPWRYNRALSYLRRPFLIRHGDSDQNPVVEVLWGIRHLNSFWKNITALCREGRLRARSKEMVRLMGEFNRRRGDKFNDEVADVFAQNPRLIVRSRVKKIGHLRLRGAKGDLGDIDVLVADQRRKRLMPVECKDLALARTPYEMSGEILNLFRGTQGKKSIVELHQQRVQWVREHLSEVLDWLGISAGQRWKVEPLIVVDRDLFTPYLQSSPIPIVPLEELKRMITRFC